jgi:hypothetical protein
MQVSQWNGKLLIHDPDRVTKNNISTRKKQQWSMYDVFTALESCTEQQQQQQKGKYMGDLTLTSS